MNMKTKYLWLVLALALLLVACQAINIPLKSTPQKENESQNRNWEVELSITGGFAGVQKRIKISSGGEVSISDENNNLQAQEQLSKEEIDRFSKLVDEIKGLQVMSNPPECADCFQYDLNVKVDGTHFQATVNDLNLQNSGVAPLVNELVNMLTNAVR